MNGYYLSAIFIGKRLLFLHFYFFSFVVFPLTLMHNNSVSILQWHLHKYSDNEMQINNTCNYKV